jgi:hypothetical protein
VQVWQLPNGTLYWESRFEGTWTTSAGALSPGAGITQTADGSGTFKEVLGGTFRSDPYTPAFGYLGTHDFGGTIGDVLGPQAGPPNPWSCDIYFTGATADNWSTWQTTAYTQTYRYKNQTWNFDNGSTTGDIVITK